MFRRIKGLMDRYINYRMAVAGAVFLGTVVFWINYSHGILPALVAATKQGTYTFFAGGFVTRNNERLAMKLENRWLSLAYAVAVNSTIAVGLTFLVHSLKGTPEPLWSTLPTLVMSIPGFAALGWREQRKSTPLAT